eukprot:SM000026S08983  [mRNA]  locus=s26:846960:847695:- [translate_table: standard]
MALAPFFGGGSGRGGRSWDPFSAIFDPFEGLSSVLDTPPAYTADQRAIANTDVDWIETNNAHVFRVDLPGVQKSDVDVRVEDHTLAISAERKREEREEGDQYHRVERVRARFLRRFRLPDNVDTDNIQAQLENGVLTVTVPKKQQQTSDIKRVDVGEGKGQQQQAIGTATDFGAAGA